MKKISAISFALRLSFAALTVSAPIALGLTGCADENDPKTWVKRLDDPAQRAPAIKRLGQFYEDAMTKSGKKRDAPEVVAVRDAIVEPMTKTYTAGGLDDKTRKDLMKALADMRDKRAAPAFAKAFTEYEAGKMDEDVTYAADAVNQIATGGDKFDQTLVDALWTGFSKFSPTKSKSIRATQGLNAAVRAVKDPSYGAKAIEKLAQPVVLVEGEQVNDQLDFWQTTATQVILDLVYKPAAKSLVSVLITKNKLKIAAIAKTALLKMPKEAVPFLSAALNGSDPDLAKAAADWGPEKQYVVNLADVLSYTSVDSARDALIAAIPSLDTDMNKRAVAQSLIWFGVDTKLTDAFKLLYNKLPAIEDKPGDDTGLDRANLLQVTSEFYDASLVPWAMKEAANAKGFYIILARLNAVQASMKVMTPESKKDVSDVLVGLEKQKLSKEETTGVTSLRSAFDLAAGVLDQCQKDTACYLKVIDEPIPSSPPQANWKVIKAAAMCAVYGNDTTKAALLEKLPKVVNPGGRLAITVAINHLAPKGDKAMADALDKIVENDTKTNLDLAKKADDVLVKVALALRARADQ